MGRAQGGPAQGSTLTDETAAAAALGLGSPVPAVEGATQHGQTRSLAALDQPYLLIFFPYAFTGVCTGELTALRDAQPEFAALGVRIVGCSTDSMYALRVFADSERLGFDLISDHWPHGAIATAFGVFDAERGCARRGSFAVDAAGVLRWRVLTDYGESRPVRDALAAAARLAEPR